MSVYAVVALVIVDAVVVIQERDVAFTFKNLYFFPNQYVAVNEGSEYEDFDNVDNEDVDRGEETDMPLVSLSLTALGIFGSIDIF